MRKICFKALATVLSMLFILPVCLYGCEKEHVHAYDQKVVTSKYLATPSDCTKKATCYYSCKCGEKGKETFEYGEKRTHKRDRYSVCLTCGSVGTDMTKDIVELGIPTLVDYSEKDTRNCGWDTHYYNGRIYRGCGDYDKNGSAVGIWSYDVKDMRWRKEFVTTDVAIQRFIEVNGKLMAPGIDPIGSWDYGNFYVLEEDGWRKSSRVPSGIHSFDMIGYDDKIFVGLGPNYGYYPLVYTQDEFNYVSVAFYKNNKLLDFSKSTQGYTATRAYELFTYKGELYCYLIYLGTYEMYKFTNGRMECVNEETYISQSSNTFNTWTSKFEFKDKLYLVTGVLYSVTDLADNSAYNRIIMPNQEEVVDAVVKDDKCYLLTYKSVKVNGKYKTTIYESETMEKNSFKEVLSFDYEVSPLSFDMVEDEFFISMGGRRMASSEKNGMMLKVKLK